MNLMRGLTVLWISTLVVATGVFTPAQNAVNGRVQAAMPADSRQVLEHSQQFIFYSIDPPIGPMRNRNPKLYFHGHRILGQTRVTNAKTRAALIQALYDSIAKSNDLRPACFSPRHAIRAVLNHKTVDLAICFECMWTEIIDAHGDHLIKITKSPQPMYNRVLSAAGIRSHD